MIRSQYVFSSDTVPPANVFYLWLIGSADAEHTDTEVQCHIISENLQGSVIYT